jgi:hypothetical protein
VSDLFYQQAIEAQISFPTLTLLQKEEAWILSGVIELVNSDGIVEDTYQIEIHPSPEFPYRFPYVYETGERIPVNIDWHVFEGSGRCCIRVPAEEIIICKKGITLTQFLSEQVVPYFFNQTFRRVNGYFLNERRHGVFGVYDYYADLLKEKRVLVLMSMLEYISSQKPPNKTDKCFCPKGSRYAKCHKKAYDRLVVLGAEQLKNDIEWLRRFVPTLIKERYRYKK